MEAEAERREDQDDPEEVPQRQAGNRQVGGLLPLAVAGLALLGETEVNREVVEGRTEPTGGIALEKTLGGTTGDSGQSRAQLGWAST